MKKGLLLSALLIMVLVLAACGNNNEGTNNAGNNNEPSTPKLSGEISIDGSSTVYPITQAIAEEFMLKDEFEDVSVTVSFSGSGNGFKKLIAGEIPIADASRTIKDAEVEELAAKGEEAIEMPVAYDGITVVVNKDNDWATEMTAAELKMIWEKDSKVQKWSDIRAEWPNEEIKLYGPGTSSGTFEYFTEAINGEAKVSREDFTPSEDDNVLVNNVRGDKYAMGYFGYAYYLENQDVLNAVAIQAEGSDKFVAPSFETIQSGDYAPLSRPIFIYVAKSQIANPEIAAFIKYYMTEGPEYVEEVGFIKLTPDMYEENLTHLN